MEKFDEKVEKKQIEKEKLMLPRNEKPKVYCSDCKYYQEDIQWRESFVIRPIIDRCKANQETEISYDKERKIYGECAVINYRNNCAAYQPRLTRRLVSFLKHIYYAMWYGW